MKKKSVRKKYTAEFKKEALTLAKSVGVANAAKQLGLYESQLYNWRSTVARKDSTSERESALQTECAKLKRQLAEQAEELAILKKAVTYFAKHQK